MSLGWRSLALALVVAVASPAAAGERPVFVRVEVASRAEVDGLASFGSIDRVEEGAAYLYTSPAGLRRLEQEGYAVTRLPDPGLNPGAVMDLAGRAPNGEWDAYPTYAGYVQMMQGFADSHPDVCRLVEVGGTTNTVSPHKLLALKISDHPDLEEDEPEVLLSSSMHGDETVGAVTLLHLADELLAHYVPASADPYDEEITRLVNGLEIWIVPMANPDGTYFFNDDTVRGAMRYYTTPLGSLTYVDPNRNFPDPAAGDHPDGNVWWTETQAMMAFAEAHSFVLAANLHGGAEVFVYPWDTWARRHPDDAWYQTLARAYADQAQADGPAGYMTDLENGITDGYDWYRVTGGRMDFMNYWHGCREVTIEVSSIKNPLASSLPTYWTANRQALLGFMAAAFTGIRGLVRDPDGRPLEAKVELPGHDADGSWVFTDPDVGDYHRLLPPGTYDLRVSAAGFIPREVAGVAVTGGEATRVNVVLEPGSETDVVFVDGFDDGTTSAWSMVASASRVWRGPTRAAARPSFSSSRASRGITRSGPAVTRGLRRP